MSLIDRVLQYTGKSIYFFCMGVLCILGMIVLLFTNLYICGTISVWCFPELWGSYDLGKGIYMIDWNHKGNVMLQGSSIEGKTCFGGMSLIPQYNDSINHDQEYIVSLETDSNWILAKTFIYDDSDSTIYKKYYIVEKKSIIKDMPYDTIINKYIYGFTDSLQFANACKSKRIKIRLNKECVTLDQNVLNEYKMKK